MVMCRCKRTVTVQDQKTMEMEMKIEMDDEGQNIATVNTDVVSFRVPHQHPHFSTSNILDPHPHNDAVNSAKQEFDSAQNTGTGYDFIIDILSGLKPFTIRLQETKMSNHFIHPSPPPRSTPVLDTGPKIKVPSFATRRAACTHLTMERLYGDFACNVCSNYSTFGWVYCCTQDTLPESYPTPEFISETSTSPGQHVNGSGNTAIDVNYLSMPSPALKVDPRFGGEDMLMPTAQLSPWIEKAIKDGHYTPEQVNRLRAQKQHVVDTAKAAIHQYEQSQSGNPNSPAQTPTTLQSVEVNPDLPDRVIDQVRGPSARNSPSAKKIRMFPFCKFCACQLCRPTHRDRAWQSLEEIFEREHEIPFIHYDDMNRPMASRSIMSTIGLHPPPLPKRPFLRSSDSRTLYSRNEAGQVFFNTQMASYRKSADSTSSSPDIADMDVEIESKGFRESMKRAFKSMLSTRQPSSRSNKKHRAVDGTDSTEEDAVEFDMGLWKELNDELLKEASGVPLPEKDSIEGLRKEVGGMGMGGIAVTEEAADLGTADVIMSV